MVSKRVDEIGSTLNELVLTDMTSKQMFRAARKRHPKATKKEIIRAAFNALIESADKDPQKASRLQQFALTQRVGDID